MAPVVLSGCLFLFVPLSPIANLIGGDKCVAVTTKLGDVVKNDKGERFEITQLGSERDGACPERMPIRARVKSVN